MRYGLTFFSGAIQNFSKITVGDPRIRILDEGLAPKNLWICVNMSTLPAQPGKYSNGTKSHRTFPKGWSANFSLDERSRHAHRKSSRTGESQILPMISSHAVT